MLFGESRMKENLKDLVVRFVAQVFSAGAISRCRQRMVGVSYTLGSLRNRSKRSNRSGERSDERKGLRQVLHTLYCLGSIALITVIKGSEHYVKSDLPRLFSRPNHPEDNRHAEPVGIAGGISREGCRCC